MAHIVNNDLEDILPPPLSGGSRQLPPPPITRIPEGVVDQIVEIIDVEKVLAEIIT